MFNGTHGKSSMKVLVYENNFSGHRANYVSLVANGLLELGHDVTVTIPDQCLGDSEVREFLESTLSKVRVVGASACEDGNAFQRARSRLKELQRIVRQESPNRVYIPYIDGLAQVWGVSLFPKHVLSSGVKIEGLLMRGGFAYTSGGILSMARSKILFSLIRRSAVDHFHILDSLVFDRIQRLYPSFASRCSFIPEALSTPLNIENDVAKAELGIANDRPVVCCPGGVDTRKGIDLLIKAFRRIVLEVPSRLLLFGKHDPSIKELLATECSQLVARGDIITVDRFATNRELELSFAAADVICVPYPRHIGVASILLKAAVLQKPILASDWGWVGWTTREEDLGYTCNVENSDAFATSLRMILKNPTSKIGKIQAERILERNTVRNQIDHWTRLIRMERFHIA